METAKLFPLHIQQSKTKKKKAVWLSLKVVHTDAYSGSRKIKKLKKKKTSSLKKKKKVAVVYCLYPTASASFGCFLLLVAVVILHILRIV